jgi:hypothetical protein
MQSASDIKTRLTVRPNEAAALLGVSRRSIERAIRDGRVSVLRAPSSNSK